MTPSLTKLCPIGLAVKCTKGVNRDPVIHAQVIYDSSHRRSIKCTPLGHTHTYTEAHKHTIFKANEASHYTGLEDYSEIKYICKATNIAFSLSTDCSSQISIFLTVCRLYWNNSLTIQLLTCAYIFTYVYVRVYFTFERSFTQLCDLKYFQLMSPSHKFPVDLFSQKNILPLGNVAIVGSLDTSSECTSQVTPPSPCSCSCFCHPRSQFSSPQFVFLSAKILRRWENKKGEGKEKRWKGKVLGNRTVV